MNISVIIPVRNEEKTIGPLLDSLLDQTLAPAEIVITDGGSTDATAEIVNDYLERGAQIQLIRELAALPGRGRNLAAAAAANEWIAFIDAGTRPESTWLEFLAEPLTFSTDADVVYGTYEPVADTLFKECAAIAYVPPPAVVDGEVMRTRSIVSALMRKSVWEAVEGFPEDLRSAEDLLFLNKIDAAGFRIVYATKALVHWSIQPGFLKTFKRFVTYSRNNIRAGLWRSWQARIYSRYALLILLAIGSAFAGFAWLLLPASLYVLMMLARAVVSIARNKQNYPASLSRNLLRLVILVPLLAVIDLATIVGGLNWLLKDRTSIDSKTSGVSNVA